MLFSWATAALVWPKACNSFANTAHSYRLFRSDAPCSQASALMLETRMFCQLCSQLHDAILGLPEAVMVTPPIRPPFFRKITPSIGNNIFQISFQHQQQPTSLCNGIQSALCLMLFTRLVPATRVYDKSVPKLSRNADRECVIFLSEFMPTGDTLPSSGVFSIF